MSKRLIGVVLAGLLLAAPALAQAAQQTPDPQQRRSRTALGPRIRSGVQSGQLTRAEAARLRAMVARTRARAHDLRGGGGALTGVERQQLRRAWRGVNRQIFRLKHNRIHRGAAR